MTPRLSPKTEWVARQQEHAVTGMLGFAFFPSSSLSLKRQVGVWINPARVDSMLACPSKANQATTLQPRTHFRNGGAPARPPDAKLPVHAGKKKEDAAAEGHRVVCFYYIWTVIWPCLASARRGRGGPPPPACRFHNHNSIHRHTHTLFLKTQGAAEKKERAWWKTELSFSTFFTGSLSPL